MKDTFTVSMFKTVILLMGFCLFNQAAEAWQIRDYAPLTTRWVEQVRPDKVLSEYPRPQMVQGRWLNLNGLWDYTLTRSKSVTAPEAFFDQILVPFPYESVLSGIGKPSIPDQCLWYRYTFSMPDAWQGQRAILHFGAVNWGRNYSLCDGQC